MTHSREELYYFICSLFPNDILYLLVEQRNDENPNIVEIVTANVGDSRIVLGDGNVAKRLTYDHRVDDPYEVARIHQAGGFLFRNRVVGVLAVTRSIGDHILKEFVIGHPYVHEMQLDLGINGQSNQKLQNVIQNKFLIIACDGLWDVLSDTDAVTIVNAYTGPKDNVAQHLVNVAIERGTTDNVTAVVVWLSYNQDNDDDDDVDDEPKPEDNDKD
jgi:serine/threonine protein phosphatase PrpC